MSKIHLTINGRAVEADSGDTILTAARKGRHPHPDPVLSPGPAAGRILPPLRGGDGPRALEFPGGRLCLSGPGGHGH